MADRRRKGSLVAAIGLAAAVALGGCTVQGNQGIPQFATSGGQTQTQLDATLDSIEGLTVDAAGSKPNTKGNTGYSFDLELDPAYEIADAPALIDFLVTSAWSVRDGYMPNTAVEIHLNAGELPTDKVDVVAAAEESGWVPVGSQAHRMTPADGGSDPEFDNGTTSVSVWLDSEKARGDDKRGAVSNRERLGAWPGSVPDLPTGVVVKK